MSIQVFVILYYIIYGLPDLDLLPKGATILGWFVAIGPFLIGMGLGLLYAFIATCTKPGLGQDEVRLTLSSPGTFGTFSELNHMNICNVLDYEWVH